MHNITDIEQYSPKWDNGMNAMLQVVQGAYADSSWHDHDFSVKLPNQLTEQGIHHSYDGDQPYYKRAVFFEDIAVSLQLDYTTIADYPRHGDTLRFMFKTYDDAHKFLSHIKERIEGGHI
jgi:hypothetical protein